MSNNRAVPLPVPTRRTVGIIFPVIAASFLAFACSRQETPAEPPKASASKPANPVPAAVQPVAADVAPSQSPAPAQSSEGRKLIRVSTLNGIDGNSEFQRNLAIVQGQQQLASTLFGQIELATVGETRDALQKQYDEALAKLNENNRKMLKAYGFSLTRNYVRVIENSHVYLSATAEEAARYEAAREAKEKSSGQPAPLPRIQ